MTVGCSHNFVEFTVIKLNCPKHSGCVFASGKMPCTQSYPINVLKNAEYSFFLSSTSLIDLLQTGCATYLRSNSTKKQLQH